MDWIIYLIVFILGSLGGALTTYSKTKGKNKALLEDIGRLEEEKQKIQSKHAIELESIKKQNSLDIELRKYKYLDKKEQFNKYFSLIDQFNHMSNTALTEKFAPMMTNFFNTAISDNNEDQALMEFNNQVMGLSNEINAEYLKIKNESNSVRLVTSANIDQLLDQLEHTIEQSKEESFTIMKVIASPEYQQDSSILEPYKQNALKTGEKINQLRRNILNEMKAELDEI